MTQLVAPQQGAGQDDITFIRAFRELVRDVPRIASERFNGDGATTTIQVQRSPIIDDELFAISIGGVAQLWTTQYSNLQSTNVFVDFDAGNLIFGTAPVVGTNNVVITKRWARWRDATILRSLYEGLKSMFPRIQTTNVDTSITLATNQWDYVLPPVFNDPRVRIVMLETQDVPSTTTPFVKGIPFQRVGNTLLKLPSSQSYSPGTILRITYVGPYQSLGDLEPSLTELPLLYAASRLLAADEVRRTRTDVHTVAANETAAPAGYLQQSGNWFTQEYERKLNDLARPIPFAGWRSTYQR